MRSDIGVYHYFAKVDIDYNTKVEFEGTTHFNLPTAEIISGDMIDEWTVEFMTLVRSVIMKRVLADSTLQAYREKRGEGSLRYFDIVSLTRIL